jgi:hypothetical protein
MAIGRVDKDGAGTGACPNGGLPQQPVNNNYRFFYIPDILLQYSLAILEVADEKILSRQRSDDIIKEAVSWLKENVPEGMTGGR